MVVTFSDEIRDDDVALIASHPDVIEGKASLSGSIDAMMEGVEATDMLDEMAASGLLNVELQGFSLFVTASSSAVGSPGGSSPSGSSDNKSSGSLLPIIIGVVAGLLLIVVVIVVVRRRRRHSERDKRTLAQANAATPSSQAFHNPIFSAEMLADDGSDVQGHYYDVPGGAPDKGDGLYSDVSFDGRGIVLNGDYGETTDDGNADGYLDVDASMEPDESFGSDHDYDNAAHQYDAHPAIPVHGVETYDAPRPFSTSGYESTLEVHVAEFHHGRLDRPTAEKMLLAKHAADGLFLVRDSSSYPDAVAISYTLRNKVRHFLLRKDGDRWLYDEKPVASADNSMDDVMAMLVADPKHHLRAPLLVGGGIADDYMTVNAASGADSRIKENPMYTDVTGVDC